MDDGCRDWEQWDRHGVSALIDSYWLASREEADHRSRLAALVRQQIAPEGPFLEVGCGSGLVYQQLVPSVFSSASYTGVDISEAMLEIARGRFKEGTFIKGDLYHLPFPDGSFDAVAAFEVFGHIGDIERPIQEMFRAASRVMAFTIWTAPETKISHELIGDAVFLHRVFSRDDLLKAIDKALNGHLYTISEQPISQGVMAYLIYKK